MTKAPSDTPDDSAALPFLADAIAKLDNGDDSTAVPLFARALGLSPSQHVQTVTAHYLVSAGLYQDTIDILRPYFHAYRASPELQVLVLRAAQNAGDHSLTRWMITQLEREPDRGTLTARLAAQTWLSEVKYLPASTPLPPPPIPGTAASELTPPSLPAPSPIPPPYPKDLPAPIPTVLPTPLLNLPPPTAPPVDLPPPTTHSIALPPPTPPAPRPNDLPPLVSATALDPDLPPDLPLPTSAPIAQPPSVQTLPQDPETTLPSSQAPSSAEPTEPLPPAIPVDLLPPAEPLAIATDGHSVPLSSPAESELTPRAQPSQPYPAHQIGSVPATGLPIPFIESPLAPRPRVSPPSSTTQAPNLSTTMATEKTTATTSLTAPSSTRYPWYSAITDTFLSLSLIVRVLLVVTVMIVMVGIVVAAVPSSHQLSPTTLPSSHSTSITIPTTAPPTTSPSLAVQPCQSSIQAILAAPQTPVHQYLFAPATGSPTAQAAISRAAASTGQGLLSQCPYLTSTVVQQSLSQVASLMGGVIPPTAYPTILNGVPGAAVPQVKISPLSCQTNSCTASVSATTNNQTSSNQMTVTRYNSTWFLSSQQVGSIPISLGN